jgi:hypothetical protein
MTPANLPGEPLPHFQAFVYALDTVLPVVDLHQQGNWIPHGVAPVVGVGVDLGRLSAGRRRGRRPHRPRQEGVTAASNPEVVEKVLTDTRSVGGP